jgi:hypothetical protein
MCFTQGGPAYKAQVPPTSTHQCLPLYEIYHFFHVNTNVSPLLFATAASHTAPDVMSLELPRYSFVPPFVRPTSVSDSCMTPSLSQFLDSLCDHLSFQACIQGTAVVQVSLWQTELCAACIPTVKNTPIPIFTIHAFHQVIAPLHSKTVPSCNITFDGIRKLYLPLIFNNHTNPNSEKVAT